MNEIILEQSTNTHVAKGNLNEIKRFSNGDVILSGKGVLIHEDHSPIGIEGDVIYKYHQLEINPVTKTLQQVFD